MTLSSSDIEIFYGEHKGKSFFPNLATYMGSGKVIALCLEKEGAIPGWRALLGPTNPDKAKREDPKSLRALFGLDGTRNGTHGSDSSESARRELSFWFNTSRVSVGRSTVRRTEPRSGELRRSLFDESACSANSSTRDAPIAKPGAFLMLPTPTLSNSLRSSQSSSSPQTMDALAYLKEFVDPIMAPLLQRILAARPDNVNSYVREDLAGRK